MQKVVKSYLDTIFPTEGFEFQYEVQSLWSDYGSLQRWGVDGKSVVVKYIQLNVQSDNSKGWGGSFSHQRKLKSYKVESEFYDNYSHGYADCCKTPALLGLKQGENYLILVLEDLKASGFEPIESVPTQKVIIAVLQWLADFHATFMNVTPNKLWDQGTYWHLQTRPDELREMAESDLKSKATEFDKLLRQAKHQTLVHGDAKLANFLTTDSNQIAGVDFQYVGGGVGVVDVMYFFTSCLSDEALNEKAGEYLEVYFDFLQLRLDKTVNFHHLKKEWSALYLVAWADFTRFLQGWSPGHWKLGEYSAKKLSEAYKLLQ